MDFKKTEELCRIQLKLYCKLVDKLDYKDLKLLSDFNSAHADFVRALYK